MQLKVIKYAFEIQFQGRIFAQYATKLLSISSCTIFPSRILPKAGRRNMYDLVRPRIICTFQFRVGSLPDCREIVLSYITHIETLGKTWDELSAGFAHLANHPMSFYWHPISEPCPVLLDFATLQGGSFFSPSTRLAADTENLGLWEIVHPAGHKHCHVISV